MKYIRYALGILIFCTGVGGFIVEIDFVKWYEIICWSINMVGFTAFGLYLLDVPSPTTTEVNLNIK